MIGKVILAIVFFAVSNCTVAQHKKLDSIRNLREFINLAEKGKWKQVKQSKGITLNYRMLVLFKEIKTREVSAKFTVTASTIDTIISNIKQPDKIKCWNEGIRSAKLLKNSNSNWILHTVYNIPFPFTRQDLVASYTIEKKKDTVILSSRSIPDYIEPQKGINREAYNLSQWRFIPKSNGDIDIEFSAVSLSGSRIPRFIKDPIIQRKLLNSFIKFKKALL